MRIFRYGVIGLIIWSMLGVVRAEQVTEQIITEKEGIKIAWKLMVPPEYKKNRAWPLIVNLCQINTAHVEHDAWPLFTKAGYFMAIIESKPSSIKGDVASALVQDLVSKIKEKYKIARSQVFTLGFSVHGRQAIIEALNHPKVFAGAISVCHIYAEESGPIPTAKEIGRPLHFLVISGSKDDNYPAIKVVWQIYRTKGHDIEFKDVDGLGHFYRVSEVPIQIEWLDSLCQQSGGSIGLDWNDAEFIGVPEKTSDKTSPLQSFIDKQAFLKDADTEKPVLIYCYSEEEKNDAPTSQAKECQDIEKKVFSFPGAEGTPVAAQYFTCFRVNVSGITPEQNSLLNRNSVPIVLLLQKDRVISLSLKSKQITDNHLFQEMKKLLSQEDSTKIDERIQKNKPVLQELNKLDKAIETKMKLIKDIKSKEPEKNRTQLEKEEKALKDLKEQYTKAMKKLKD